MIRSRKNFVSWVLVWLMLVSPSLVFGQQPAAARPAPKIDLSYITPDAALAAVARPRRVLTAARVGNATCRNHLRGR